MTGRRVLVAAVVFMLAGALGFPSSALADQAKVDICHFDSDTSTWKPLRVTEKNLLGHLRHGDVLVGDVVDETCDPPPSGPPRLPTVRDRGFLRCGVHGALPGFSLEVEPGVFEGMDADFCRAVAAAVLGDGNAVEFVSLSAVNRFEAVANGTVDVLFRNSTNTLTRDRRLGLDAGPTYFYDGQGFAVHESSEILGISDLPGATVCVVAGSEAAANVAALSDEIGLVVFESFFEALVAFFDGECDASTTDKSGLAAILVTSSEDPTAYRLLPETISKEPLAPYMMEGDDDWEELVAWVVHAVVYAEEVGVTSANVDAYRAANPDSAPFGTGFSSQNVADALLVDIDWAYRMVLAVGNYGEIYERHFGLSGAVSIPRSGTLNELHTEGGLHYSLPIR